ncbi:hypothetical protein P8935_24155 [Telmatobacter sp. DSM 110680]|uniref:Uncharacterized protein n=1 Tax=Telmatobacter sp. DSM 110680 TaxID=3036704 RepID=A0AAU7DJY8_9BACT
MPLTPTLQTRYDENSIPISAKCSLCGERMPQGTPRITDPIENVAWFSSQFGLHVAQIHPEIEARTWVGKSKKSNARHTQKEVKG